MESLTKNKQTEETITKMVEKHFTPLKMAYFHELTEGYFNMAYEIRLSNGKQLILKIAPSPQTRVMTYEKNIMFSEVEAMRMAARTGGIPVPEILGYDDSRTICDSPYFFMEKLEGTSLHSVKAGLPPEQVESIYMETGRINRKINDIPCPAFGYPGQREFQGKDWFSVFCRMMAAGVKDAEQGKVDLKIPVDELWRCLERDRSIFEEVDQPKLVHWDCWDGNIFVRSGRVTGIIDWERSIWGDPLMEVGFRTYSDNTCFQRGYGIKSLTESQKRRALWYDVYLMLLVALECEYRKYDTLDTYYYAAQMLGKQFEKIQEAHGGEQLQ